ncbi:MAG: phosphate-starvation-inducible PsiE family protein [Eubacterium sp.]|nr:phosphate-starvation-inducible PsiE family protein [Eubacterium sp.]
MWEKFQKQLLIFSRALELFIALLIAVAVTVSAAELVLSLWGYVVNYQSPDQLSVFLDYAFGTLIGIEFLKMLLKHSTSSVIEVMLFAVARQLIVEHTTPLENLLGIITIAILFIVRKYLYVSTFDDEGEAEDRETTRKGAGLLNRLTKGKEKTEEED